MSDWTIKQVLEEYIADRTKPSRRKLAFLKQMHEINVNSDSFPLVCPSYISKELDLPNGTSWAYVVADFLDFIEGQKVGHTVTKHKMELGVETKSIDLDSIVLTVDSVIEDYISERELSKRKVDFLEETYLTILNSLSDHTTESRYYYSKQDWLTFFENYLNDDDLNEDGKCLEILCIASLLDIVKPIRLANCSRRDKVRPLIKKLFTPSEDHVLNEF